MLTGTISGVRAAFLRRSSVFGFDFCVPDTRLTLFGRPVPLLGAPPSPKAERILAKKPSFFFGVRDDPLRGRLLLLLLVDLQLVLLLLWDSLFKLLKKIGAIR